MTIDTDSIARLLGAAATSASLICDEMRSAFAGLAEDTKGINYRPAMPAIQFTNLDVQRAFDLTETEAFNFTHALVERGFLRRDLMVDSHDRAFFVFTARSNYVV